MKQLVRKLGKQVWQRKNTRYLLLGLPGVLMPTYRGMSLSGDHFGLGLPPLAWLTVGCSNGGYRVNHFDLFELVPLAILACGWSILAYAGCFVRQQARQRGDWIGATIQASLTTTYAFLWFFLFVGVAQVLWSAGLSPLDGSHLERAFILTRRVYPVGCVVVALLPLAGVWIDSHTWAGFLRTPYVLAALFSLAILGHVGRIVPFQMGLLEEMAESIRAEGAKNNSANTPPQGMPRSARQP